jgi:hypothetical protein
MGYSRAKSGNKGRLRWIAQVLRTVTKVPDDRFCVRRCLGPRRKPQDRLSQPRTLLDYLRDLPVQEVTDAPPIDGVCIGVDDAFRCSHRDSHFEVRVLVLRSRVVGLHSAPKTRRRTAATFGREIEQVHATSFLEVFGDPVVSCRSRFPQRDAALNWRERLPLFAAGCGEREERDDECACTEKPLQKPKVRRVSEENQARGLRKTASVDRPGAEQN